MILNGVRTGVMVCMLVDRRAVQCGVQTNVQKTITSTTYIIICILRFFGKVIKCLRFERRRRVSNHFHHIFDRVLLTNYVGRDPCAQCYVDVRTNT